MTEYFENHGVVTKFPWSIYHKPLEKNLETAIAKVNQTRPNIRLSTIGPGLMNERSAIPQHWSIDVMDIDPNVIESLKQNNDHRIINYYHLPGIDKISESACYDFIYAKEVIEHIEDSPYFLAQIKRLLKPQGHAWLSTPNYGYWLLPFIESTFLEFVAYLKGFSRKSIHPNKFNIRKLENQISEQGFKNITLNETPLKLALSVFFQKN